MTTIEYNRAWRAENKEKVKAAARRYYEKHKEKIRAKQKRSDKQKAAIKEWRERNPEKVKAAQARYRAKRPDGIKARTLNNIYLAKYGITYEYAKKLKAKGCQACGTKEGKMCIDHDHTKPGTYRGCLCNGCNSALGMIRESLKATMGLCKYITEVCKHG